MKRLGLSLLLVPVLAAQTSYSPCDINHDGVINVEDVQLMINQALGLSPCTADLTGNGVCSAMDVQIVINADLTGVCNAGTAASIAITPATGSTISGTTVFSADTTNAPTAAMVEFDLGSLELGVAATSPFNLSWNTGFAADGLYSVLAKAYDSSGALLAQATSVVQINNHGGAMSIGSPNLTQPLTGQVTLSMTGQDPSGYYPARWNVFLDGVEETITWSDNTGQNPVTVTAAIDTTVVPNGAHELHVEVASDYWPAGQQTNKTWYDHRIALSYVVTINNGHTLMAVTPGYQHVYLQPHQTLALSCTRLFTDNTSGPCSAPSYSSSDTSVVTVSSTGLVTAGAGEGFATVALTEARQNR